MPTKTGPATIGPSADSSARPWFAESRCAYQQVDADSPVFRAPSPWSRIFTAAEGSVPVGDYGCGTAALQRANRRTMPRANRVLISLD
jgi:hypothetical protein